MSEASSTPAQLSTLALYSVTGGVRGVYSQDGTKTVGTSAGLKQSEWNYSSEAFSNIAHHQASKYLVTTMESSKDAGLAGVETQKPTKSSGGFTSYWKKASDTILITRYVNTAQNPADGPSGGIYPPRHHNLDDNGRPTNLAEGDLTRIGEVLRETFAPTTRNTYGTGLLIFHVFCDNKGIEEEHRAPVIQALLSSFISTLAGTYGGSTIQNYVYAVRAWHIIHGAKWKINEDEVEALLKASSKLSPKEARRKEKKPWSVTYLTDICQKLHLNKPKDAAIHVCLTTAFWGTARLGEVTV